MFDFLFVCLLLSVDFLFRFLFLFFVAVVVLFCVFLGGGGVEGGPEWVRGLGVGVAYSRLFTPNIGQIVYSFYGFVLRSRCP